MAEGIMIKKDFFDFVVMRRAGINAQCLASSIDPLNCTTDDADLRMLLHELGFQLKAVRHRHVVSVHNSDISALGEKTNSVSRLGQATMGCLPEYDPAVFGRVAGNNGL